MKKIVLQILRWVWLLLKWTVISVVILAVTLSVAVNLQPVQQFIINKAATEFGKTTGGQLEIESFDLRIPYRLSVSGLNLYGPEGDRIARMDRLEVHLAWRMLFDRTAFVESFLISGLNADIYSNTSGEWNYDFILRAFASEEEAALEDEDETGDADWDVRVKKVDLKDITFRYYDAETLDSVVVFVGEFGVRMRRFSLLGNAYHAEYLRFRNSDSYIRLGPSSEDSGEPDPEAADTAESELPSLFLSHLLLQNHKATFIDLSDGSSYKAALDHLELHPETIDLAGDRYRVSEFGVRGFNLDMRLPESPPSEEPFDGDIFAPLFIGAEEVNLEDISFSISSFNEVNETSTLIELRDLGLSVKDLETDPESYRIGRAEASLNYPGLPQVNHLSLGAEITPQSTRISDLRLLPGKSSLSADFAVGYSNLAEAVNDLVFRDLNFDLTELRLDPSDLRALLELAETEEPLPALPSVPVRARASLRGSNTALDIRNIGVSAGGSSVRISGKSRGAELAKHAFLLSGIDVNVLTADLNPWLPDSLDRDLLPGKVAFSGKGKAAPLFSSLDGTLKLPYGDISLSVSTGGWDSEVYNLSADLGTEYLDLASFAEVDTFFTRFSASARLEDLTGDDFRGHVAMEIPFFGYDNIRVHNINIADTVDGDFHRFGLSLNDTSAVFDLSGTAALGETVSVDMIGNLSGADFQYLGLTEKDIRLQTRLRAEYTGNDSIMYGGLNLGEVVVVREGERIDLSPSEARFWLSPDSTGVTVSSDLFSLSSESNLSAEVLQKAVTSLYKDERDEAVRDDGYWNFDFRSEASELIRDLFLPDLDRLDPAKAKVRYTAADHAADAKIVFPRTEISGAFIDSLALEVKASGGDIFGSFGIRRAGYDSLAVDLIALTARPDTGGTRFTFTLGDVPDLAPYHIGAVLTYFSEDSLRGPHTLLKPNTEFILNGQTRDVDPEACFRFSDSGTQIYNFTLTAGDERFSMSKETGVETLEIDADNFDLGFLSGMLDLESDLIAGLLSAAVLINSDGTFEGEGAIEGLMAPGVDLGRFSFSGESVKTHYRVSADLIGPLTELSAAGRIIPREDGDNELDIRLEISEFSAAKIAEIAPEFVQKASGKATGGMTVSGLSSEPKLTGQLDFKDISLRLKGSNGAYMLADETIRIEPQALVFPGFSITDSAGYKLTVDGKVSHKNFSNIRYDLSVKSNRFTLADFKEDKDADFYGKLIVGADIRITGTDVAPKVRSNVSLLRGSSVVFKVPESEYRQFDDDGLVEWVIFNQESEDEIMRRDKSDDLPPAVLTVIDLAGTVNIDPETKLRIVIDPIAGDYLEIEGGGKLDVSYDKAGRINLSGTYSVTGGAYLMTFYNVVKRKFLIEEGSRITWNGDPMSADLDLTAIYPTRASAIGLMSGANPNAAGDGLRRMLDWEVLMNIKGELEMPSIDFDLRLARASRGNTAIESRLAQLRDNESELNKQVFGLMLFNSFIPDGGGTGGGNMVGNQARSSASQLLTQQLNNLSDKLVGGVELTFDLQSYESSGMSETDLSVDLSKTMFNDRVVVRVGSTVALEQNDPAAAQNAGQLMTNFVVEYKLTEDGRYRLKAFRKTDVEDILVGLLTRTGAGFVFRRTFDRRDEIFRKTEEEIVADKEAAEAEKENGASEERAPTDAAEEPENANPEEAIPENE